MNLKEYMIKKLQEILKHERKHFNFYLQASVELKGPERLYLKPLLEKEMTSELEHIRQFGEKIVALGAIPTQESYPFTISTDKYGQVRLHHVLGLAIAMEREVLKLYHELYPSSEEYTKEFNDMSIELLLEENIEHTTADVEEMERIMLI